MGSFLTDNRSPIYLPLPGAVNGIGAGKAMTIKMDPGPTFLGLILKCFISTTGATRTEIGTMLTNWRLSLSGTDLWNLTGVQLLSWIEYYRTGLIANTGYVFIPFSRLWQRTSLGALNPAVGTQGETSFQLQITQDATSTIDSVEATAIIDPVVAPLGAHVRMKTLTPNLALGENDIINLYRNPGDFLYAIHIEVPTAAYLTEMSYSADGVRIFDKMTQAMLAQLYLEPIPVRTLQTGTKIITLDFCRRGFDDDAIPLNMNIQNLKLKFGTSAPGLVTIMQEIGTLEPTAAGVARRAAA
jgi:hypothetical protein